jgi:DNA-binding response OmpR family regulator
MEGSEYNKSVYQRRRVESLSKKVVMIVDDDWMNREIIEAYLLNADYEVISAHSGEQALELAAQKSPDLVLLDVRMQGINGIEVCRRLKTHPNTRLTPVLIVTALSSEQEKVDAIAAGADDFVPKPLDSTMMLNRIKTFARLKQLTQSFELRQETLRNVLARHVNSEIAEAILADLNSYL